MQSPQVPFGTPEEILAQHGLTGRVASVVGGESLEGDGPAQRVIDPSTGDGIAEFRDGGRRSIREATAAAAEVAQVWARTHGRGRGRILAEIAAAVRQHAVELAALESLDSGKPLPQAKADVETAAAYFEFYGGAADKIYGDTIEQVDGFAYTHREPLGVVGVITPWNSPIAQLARSVAPALAAGNVVVAKPSELAPLSSVTLVNLAEHAGLPRGVLNVVLGLGSTAGAALAADPLVAHVSFTGSVATGAAVARAAASRIATASLELGGKSATIVMADADLEAAANAGVAAVVRNAGQSCFATTRLLVHRDVRAELIARMRAKIAGLSIGPGLDSPDLGPLVSEQQLRRVRGFVDRALDGGALNVVGDTAPLPASGYFCAPVILDNVTNDMEVAQSEVFGPVQTIIEFCDEDQAVDIANDSIYGLAAGVFTNSIGSAHRIAARLQAGQIHVNRYPLGGVDTPFGGYKKSGIGREKGLEALRHYTHTKTVLVHVGT
jgi:aldehyde dehydrogenase (NAD+)